MKILKADDISDKDRRFALRSNNLKALSKTEKEELLKMAIRALHFLCDEWIPYLYHFHQAKIEDISMEFDTNGELRITMNQVSILYNLGTNTARFDLSLPKRYSTEQEVYEMSRRIFTLLSPNIKV